MIPLPRLRRRTFWLAVTAAWFLFLVVREAFSLEHVTGAATAWAALQVLVLLVLSTARLHDRGRSAWALSAALIPVVGALWLCWELACRRGSVGTNAYGRDPRTR